MSLTNQDKTYIENVVSETVTQIVIDAHESLLKGIGGMFDETEAKIVSSTTSLKSIHKQLSKVETDIRFIKQDIRDIKADLSDSVSRKEFNSFKQKVDIS